MHQVLKERAIDSAQLVSDLGNHSFEWFLKLGHDIILEGFLKFWLHDAFYVLHVLVCWLLEDSFKSWDQHLSHLAVDVICLLLEDRGQSLLNLLLNQLGHGGPNRLGDRDFDLNLNILLRLHLLVQLIELYVQVSVLLIQFIVVFDQQVLLTFSGGWNRLFRDLLLRLNLNFWLSFL